MKKIPPIEEAKWGKLRGKRVLLATAMQKYGQHDLEQIEVAHPDGGTIRPWRFASSGSEVTFEYNPDGSVRSFSF